jgi:hypothetical protein
MFSDAKIAACNVMMLVLAFWQWLLLWQRIHPPGLVAHFMVVVPISPEGQHCRCMHAK